MQVLPLEKRSILKIGRSCRWTTYIQASRVVQVLMVTFLSASMEEAFVLNFQVVRYHMWLTWSILSSGAFIKVMAAEVDLSLYWSFVSDSED